MEVKQKTQKEKNILFDSLYSLLIFSFVSYSLGNNISYTVYIVFLSFFNTLSLSKINDESSQEH